ncbi:hypothetical protein SY2F82_35290 [Streptomyces sp. Y2F8-2]|uniref:hypothetical protein n=1 Tax=Streptomyces sp. Y2F8-2 TaxID=2759675 RepID=UPI001902CF08|nr:hypothetical protein SY2F82_35290 [Streptomyces sp. Y2F8-2]
MPKDLFKEVTRSSGFHCEGCSAATHAVGFQERAGERLGSLLRDVVTDALQRAVDVRSGELAAVGRAVVRRGEGGQRTVERDGGHVDGWTFGKPRLEVLVARVARCEPEPPAVIVDDDVNVVRVVERLGGAVEDGVAEVPGR